MSINFSLVLPCYNEEKNIAFLCNEFLNLPIEDYKAELILVNNGSEDNTKHEIEEFIKKNNSKNIIIKLVHLEKNKGYGGGISEGLSNALGDYIGWAHADLQTPLIDFLKLFKLIKNKKNILGKGFRTNNRGFDGIISRMHENLASLILGVKMREVNAQPKIFNRELMKYFKNIPFKWTTLDTYAVYICLKNQIQIKSINVIFNTRKYGQSKWKNNFVNFISHIFFNILYLFKLRFTKDKNDSK
jgi:glycosyltransferase involved in cell wall biosynthesis